MKCYRTNQKYIAFACSCLLMVVLTSQHADAARRSRVFSIALFASGMGLQVGSTFLKASAQEHYDTYLNAAIQADIQTHKDAFRVRRNASTIMSGVGLGCVGLAVLFSIYNQLDTPSESSESAVGALSAGSRLQVRSRTLNARTVFSGNTGLLIPRTSFQLLPHYDFRTGNTSLRLLHIF